MKWTYMHYRCCSCGDPARPARPVGKSDGMLWPWCQCGSTRFACGEAWVHVIGMLLVPLREAA